MQAQKVIYNDRDPDHIYVDATFYNNSTSSATGTQYIQAKIGQTRTSPFLYNTDLYNMSIVRFTIDSSELARVHQSLGTTGGNSDMVVSLSRNGVYYDTPLVIPTALDETQQPEKALYNVYDFMDLINSGYLTSQNAVVAAGGSVPFGQPTMLYDDASGYFTMNIPDSYGTGTVGTTGNGIGVHMSFQLYQRFQSFPIIQNSPIQCNGHDMTFKRSWHGNNRTPSSDIYLGGSTGSTGYYMVLNQDAPWPSSILDLSRLVITTSTLPIVSEYKSTSNFVPTGTNNTNQTLAIVTDFLIGQDAELQARGESFRYVPDVYRLTSMNGSVPLTSWDLQCFVADTRGELFPLLIPPGGSIDVKMLFLRKGLSN